MEFKWIYQQEKQILLRDYLQQVGLPRNFIKAVKFSGGRILKNRQEVTVRALLESGDEVTIIPPVEEGHDSVLPSNLPLNIIYEDRDVLVINKPEACVSIPSLLHPDSSIANRVKGYYLKQGYLNQVIHIVTRLDRDTTGLMLIAKHRLAHALLDKAIQNGQVNRYYYAISHKTDWPNHGFINEPIARDPDSIICRRVHETGQYALTEYWKRLECHQGSLLKLKLHTGRTHQIRVHLSYCGGPLLGDDLYGGQVNEEFQRQALHCGQLIFQQPFTEEQIILKQDLPDDMKEWIMLQEKGCNHGNI